MFYKGSNSYNKSRCVSFHDRLFNRHRRAENITTLTSWTTAVRLKRGIFKKRFFLPALPIKPWRFRPITQAKRISEQEPRALRQTQKVFILSIIRHMEYF